VAPPFRDPVHPALPTGRIRAIATYLAVLAAALCCYAALGAVLSVLPGYVSRLGGDPLIVGLAVGAPALTGALGRPAGGRLADRFGAVRVMVAGALIMAGGTAPAVRPVVAVLLASRLATGAGEALMMAAAVAWLLQLAGPARRGRALGHIGLANYAGLLVGPLLAAALAAPGDLGRLWTAAVALPVIGAALAGSAARGTPAAGPIGIGADRHPAGGPMHLLRITARAGAGLLLVNVGYVALLSFGAAAAAIRHSGVSALVIPIFGAGVIVSRTLLAALPDRVGAARTLIAATIAASGGLVVLGATGSTVAAIAGLLVLAVGQGLAAPSKSPSGPQNCRGVGLACGHESGQCRRVPPRARGAGPGRGRAGGGVGLVRLVVAGRRRKRRTGGGAPARGEVGGGGATAGGRRAWPGAADGHRVAVDGRLALRPVRLWRSGGPGGCRTCRRHWPG